MHQPRNDLSRGSLMIVWLLQRSEPTPHDTNGKQRLFRTGIMAEALSRSGHKVVWWTSTFNHYNRCQRFSHNQRLQVTENYSIQYVKSTGYKKNISLARLKDNRVMAKNFAKLVEHEKCFPDVIIVSIPTAELACEAIRFAKSRGIPVVLDVRDLWPDFILESVPAVLKPFAYIGLLPLIRTTRWVFRNADAVVGLTDDFVNWGLSYANRKRGPLDRVFPMGYIKKRLNDEEKAEGNIFWESYNIGAHDGILNVVFVGSLGRTSDLFIVLDAARLLQNRCTPVRFIICGDGEQYSTLQKIAVTLDNVIMPGWINDVQIRTLLEHAHIGLAPYIASPNYTKNLPNKPAEYLSAGLAIATSLSTGPLVNLIEEYDCGFSYMNNADILADKLMSYTDQGTLYEARKNAIKVFESHLNGDKIYFNMISYLEKIALDQGCKHPVR